tara:strand:+ start:632 stop:958 length:327 start_codon:yes stop_codon:yes gene_type:complete
MSSNKLEQAAIAARNALLPTNTYNSADDGNNYSATHTRALSDQETPVAGKGTGIFLDTYNGGGSVDINGATNAVGSGRIQNVAKNEFDGDNQYVHPDTSGNEGQFTFG